jgi:hypothetical protein
VGKPRVFIGSSSESLDIAYSIQSALEPEMEVTVWSQGIFEPQQYNLEALLAALDGFDFSVFVFNAEDLALIRDKEHLVVRDNVIFELGMFLGRLGRNRCFMVMPKTRGGLHLPTDLLGLYPLTFDPDRQDKNLAAALGSACHSIRQAIRKNPPGQSAADTQLFVDLPGNAGLFQKSYRDFHKVVQASLEAELNENTAEVLQAARTDAENRTFNKDPLPQHVDALKAEVDRSFTEMMRMVLSKPATPFTSDVIRVISIGRSNAFYKLDNPHGAPA